MGMATDNARGECASRNRSPWFSFGYLLMIAVIVVVIVLILWVA
jgi:hypothetical protein